MTGGISEDRTRDMLAWVRAHAVDDREAVAVLAAALDVEQLARDLATYALMLIRNLPADPLTYLDRSFDAVITSYREDPE